MRVAVPLYDSCVAPRFGFARAFMIAKIEKNQVEQLTTITIAEDAGWHERLAQLSELGVVVLLCGGFNRHFRPLAGSLGIDVVFGLVGDARDLIDTYARGEKLPVSASCCFHNGSRRAQRKRRGHGGGPAM